MNEYINLTEDNIEREHLCCAISDPKHQSGVQHKREWLKERIREGHVFRKLNQKGKVFIEYAPLEKAWCSVQGTNYLYIYCLWVAGSYKGHGYGKELLEYAIHDAKEQGKSGLCTITSKKKKPYLSEKKFFLKYGFQVVDTIGEYELLALSFDGTNPLFSNAAHKMEVPSKDLTIYYTLQCPFTYHCIEEIEAYQKKEGKTITVHQIRSAEEAKQVPCVFQNWANFLDGKFVSNQLLNENMIRKLYEKGND